MTDSKQTHRRLTVLCECLSESRRRYLLHRLQEVKKSLALADLAENVADWETETPRAEIADETVKDVHRSLYHNHVPKLADAGLVQYERERDTVKLSEFPEELRNNEQFLTAE